MTKYLLGIDMDSTLIAVEFIDELAKAWGVGDEVAELTRGAMERGEEFSYSLKKRASLLKGMPLKQVEKLATQVPLQKGADVLLPALKERGFLIAVISGGFTAVVESLKGRLPIDYHCCNNFIVKKGLLTGEVKEPIVDGARKAAFLRELAQREGIHPAHILAVGDGANDRAMLQAAGLGVAFYGKAKLKEVADICIEEGGLEQILQYLENFIV